METQKFKEHNINKQKWNSRKLMQGKPNNKTELQWDQTYKNYAQRKKYILLPPPHSHLTNEPLTPPPPKLPFN